jgi:hypothetical protein
MQLVFGTHGARDDDGKAYSEPEQPTPAFKTVSPSTINVS